MRAGGYIQRGIDQMVWSAVARIDLCQWHDRAILLLPLNEGAGQLIAIKPMRSGEIHVKKQDCDHGETNRNANENEGSQY